MAYNVMDHFDPKRQIAIIWSVSDVRDERPDLSEEEAFEVLSSIEDNHDANYGITWQTILDTADDLYPLKDIPKAEWEQNNCGLCANMCVRFPHQCAKYDPDVNAIDEEGDEVYCRNFEERAVIAGIRTKTVI